MYRIIAQSYFNYMSKLKAIDTDCYRFKLMEPLHLIFDLVSYKEEKNCNTENYQKVCDLIFYIENSLDQHPRLKVLLWTLESRDIVGKQFNVVSEIDLAEQVKTLEMFTRLMYWNEIA